MDEDYCVYKIGGDDPGYIRYSERLNRWSLWTLFFVFEVAKRLTYLPASCTRNTFCILYAGFGLTAMFSYAFKTVHVVCGTLYVLTGSAEISVLWYPCCGPLLGPGCPDCLLCCCFCCCSSRRRAACCAPERRTAIAVGVYIWIHTLSLLTVLGGPIIGIIPHFDFFGVQLAAVVEWTLVTVYQVIHYNRAPALAAAKYGHLNSSLHAAAYDGTELLPPSQPRSCTTTGPIDP